jgi:hypothetical protein
MKRVEFTVDYGCIPNAFFANVYLICRDVFFFAEVKINAYNYLNKIQDIALNHFKDPGVDCS